MLLVMWRKRTLFEGNIHISPTITKKQVRKGPKPGKPIYTNRDEAIEDSNRINRNEANMPIFHTELAGNPNSCLVKVNNRKYQALLHLVQRYHYFIQYCMTH